MHPIPLHKFCPAQHWEQGTKALAQCIAAASLEIQLEYNSQREDRKGPQGQKSSTPLTPAVHISKTFPSLTWDGATELQQQGDLAQRPKNWEQSNSTGATAAWYVCAHFLHATQMQRQLG